MANNSFLANVVSKSRYLLCAAAVAPLLMLVASLAATPAWFGVYYCITFWGLIATEAVLTQQGVNLNSNWAAEDRFLGYLFSAPLVWPVRLFELLSCRTCTTAA